MPIRTTITRSLQSRNPIPQELSDQIRAFLRGQLRFPSDPTEMYAHFSNASQRRRTRTVPSVEEGSFLLGARRKSVIKASTTIEQKRLTAGRDGAFNEAVKTLRHIEDADTRKARTAAHSSYRPTTNPLTATDAGATATVSVAAFTMRVPGKNISVNSGSVASLSYATDYYIYYDDPTFAGGAVTYAATTVKETALNGTGRFYVGSIRTPKSGGSDMTGNNDGGTGAQIGSAPTISPLRHTVTLAGQAGDRSATNPERVRDRDLATSATFRATDNLTGIDSVVATYDTFYGTGPFTSLTLKARSQVSTSAASCMARLRYSLDGGNTWTDIYNLVNATRALTTDSIALSNVQELGLIQVEFSVQDAGGTLGTGVTLLAYEVWVEAVN